MDEKKFEKMLEMMKSCCPGEDGLADCCSKMQKMMERIMKQKGDGCGLPCGEMIQKMMKDFNKFQKRPEESRE